MRYRLRTLLIVLVIGPMAIACCFWFVAWSRLNTTNCGGNSAALSDVRCYVTIAQMAADESTEGQFLVTQATPSQLNWLSEIASDPWLRGGQLLVSMKPYRLEPSEPRRIIAVCDRPFTNVPRYIFGQAPPTHAAAYSDGSTALLTATEFAALDRSTMIPLNQLVP
jgi:hypothetical protein